MQAGCEPDVENDDEANQNVEAVVLVVHGVADVRARC